MDWSQVTNTFQQALVTILTAVVTAGAGIAVLYVNKLRVKLQKQITAIEDETTSKLADEALERVSMLAESVVKSIEQELVKDIKKGIENGTKTRDDLLALKNEAVANVISQLTPEVMEYMNTQILDVESYVSDLVSRHVYELRNK